MRNETYIEKPETYFYPKIMEEEMPITISPELNKKYYKIESIYNLFYTKNSISIAKEKSKEERENKRINDDSFVYGEITFRSIAYIYEYIKIKFGNIIEGNFYDLGSGSGKGVLAFSLIRKFNLCIGIEFLENLTKLSIDMKKNYDNRINNIYEENKILLNELKEPNQIKFINGDFLKENWKDASILLMNSTCFTQDLVDKITIKAINECKSGTIIISFTKKLWDLGNDWECNNGFKRLMSWGIATVYVHRKK